MPGTERPPQARRVTSREVAERAGVSRATVSFVLNGVRTDRVSEATRERVLRAARDLAYIPDAAARTLVSGKTGTVGLVVSKAEHIRVDAFVPQTLNSLSQVCGERGYRLLVDTSDAATSPYDYDQLVGARQVDGLVVLNPDPGDDRLTTLIEQGFPLVLIGAHRHPSVATVSVNSTLAMQRATRHLIALGHRCIGFIHYREIVGLEMGGRFKGYRAALDEAGITIEPRWIRSGNFSAESGHAAMRSLLAESERPTAVVMGNDTIAMGAMAATVEHGLRVPQDIAVVGFDDIPLARYAVPALTTVRLPASDMATACGRMVLDLIAGRPLDLVKRMFEAELIVRRSCGATPGE